MQNIVRLLALLLVVIASVAAFSTPTPKKATVYAEGGAPMPMCDPDVPCNPGVTAAHR